MKNKDSEKKSFSLLKEFIQYHKDKNTPRGYDLRLSSLLERTEEFLLDNDTTDDDNDEDKYCGAI